MRDAKIDFADFTKANLVMPTVKRIFKVETELLTTPDLSHASLYGASLEKAELAGESTWNCAYFAVFRDAKIDFAELPRRGSATLIFIARRSKKFLKTAKP